MSEETFIFHGPTPPYEPAKGGIGFELFRCINIHKDKIAEYIIETGESSTYQDLLERSRRVALHLLSRNLKKEDIVCLCSHNHLFASVPLFASKFIDVNYASIEPSIPEDDLIYLLEYVKPKVLFVDGKVEEKVEECLKRANLDPDIIIFGKSKKYLSFEDIIRPIPGEEDITPVVIENLKEIAVIFFSSGTTGKPKGICCDHYSLLAQFVNTAHIITPRATINLSNYLCNVGDVDGEPRDNLLLYAPPYWLSGIGTILLAAMKGGIRTIGASFDGETAWKAIEKFKPNAMFLPAGQVVELYLKRNQKTPNINNIEVCLTAGSPVKPVHMAYLNEMFPEATPIQLLAMTEAQGPVSGFVATNPQHVELQKKYPASCGRISYGMTCKIVDLDTEHICAFNQQGELRIKSKYITSGYYKMDSSSAFDSEGWFKTGDLGFINEEGCLILIDRIKDILLYTLYNIRPSVIEEILAQHPSVYECIVIGIPHAEDNEHPMGIVILKEEYKSKVTSEEILTFVNERVPSDRYKIRAGIKFVEKMIKTPTGKIKKLDMKNEILQAKLT